MLMTLFLAPTGVGDAQKSYKARMRELFDEVAGQSPFDPEEAVRRATRVPQRKRFYTSAGTAEADGGFAVTLDGKPIRTPSGRQVVAPNRVIAEAIAAEWNAQGETVNPLTMPLTRFANSVGEAVVDRVDAVAEDAAKYLGTDLLFYRAGHPEALVAREAAHWDPILYWAANDLGAHFILAEGIVHVAQPEPAIRAARATFPADPWSVAALHVVTTLTGSALLALALYHGVRSPDEVWAAAHVDEDWNIEKWGIDDEVAARRKARLVDFTAAVTILKGVKP
jgi:chaperone required for assembly of F1-ATPase